METFTLNEIQEKLLAGRTTMLDLVKHYLSQIEKNNHLNAYTEVFRDEALNAAAAADCFISENSRLPGKLSGCVISVKDLICIKNHKVSAGSLILDGFRSVYHSTAIQLLLDAGAIIIGRTNCDEFGMGSANTNCYYGVVRNAVDFDRIAGGSSGGAAVSVQIDSCLIAVGTDTGGSVRQPASMCGLIGYKPTYGMVSRYGLIAYASSFDQLGLIGKNTEDIQKVMEVISVKDPKDATMYQKDLYHSTQSEKYTDKKNNLKIACFKEIQQSDKNIPEIRSSISSVLDHMKGAGHEVQEVNFHLIDYLVPCYYILTTAEASSNLSRYDGVRFGYRAAEYSSLAEMYVKSRSEGFGREVKKRIMLGTFVLSEAYYDAYYTKAQKVRRIISEFMDNLLKEFDFLVLPTVPETAWNIDESPADPLKIYMSDVYTVLANLSGLPAISIPAGNDDKNLPFGIQLMTGKKKDKILLNFASDLHKWHNS